MLPDRWKKLPLSDAANIRFSTVDKKTYEEQRAIFLCNYTDVFYNRRITSNLKFMASTASDNEIGKYQLEKGDVVFTKDSETPEEIGICTLVAENIPDLVCGYHLGIARSNRKICLGEYLSFVLSFHPVHHQLVRAANGVTRYGLTLESISQAYIPLPPLAEQRKIAAILRTWDDAIERQARILELTQKKRKALLSKLLSDHAPNKSLKSFAKPVARAIPTPTESYCALGLRSHCKGTFQRFIKDAATIDMESVYQVKENDLIVNITFAWEGAIALVKKDDEHCVVSHRFPTYEIDTIKALPQFIRHVVQTKRFVEHLGIISPGGAGRNRVMSKKDFLELKIWLPDTKTQAYIADIISTVEVELETATRLLEKFKYQKRGLMQKLLTGEWSVAVNTQTDNKKVAHA